VPIYFAYEPDHLNSFAAVGKKIEWMRANPKVCVELDEVISHFHALVANRLRGQTGTT
jgi:hypothetical protein